MSKVSKGLEWEVTGNDWVRSSERPCDTAAVNYARGCATEGLAEQSRTHSALPANVLQSRLDVLRNAMLCAVLLSSRRLRRSRSKCAFRGRLHLVWR